MGLRLTLEPGPYRVLWIFPYRQTGTRAGDLSTGAIRSGSKDRGARQNRKTGSTPSGESMPTTKQSRCNSRRGTREIDPHERPDISTWLTLPEAAKHFRLGATYLRQIAAKRRLRAFKIGRNWYTTAIAVNEYLESRSVRGAFRSDRHAR